MLTTHADPSDGRRRVLRTTTVNADYWRARNPADHAAVAEWFSVLSDEELSTFRTLAVRLLRAQGGRSGDAPARTDAPPSVSEKKRHDPHS
jgi:DNA-binding MarR family transcriptional regulator